MKIDDKDVLSSSLNTIARTGAGNNSMRPQSTANLGQTPSGDAVDLSSNSKVFTDALAAGDTVRSARTAELQKLYSSGQYTVDAQEVSRAIIDAHLSGG